MNTRPPTSDPWLRFWTLLQNEYRSLCDQHGDDQGTAVFQERMDQRAKETTR